MICTRPSSISSGCRCSMDPVLAGALNKRQLALSNFLHDQRNIIQVKTIEILLTVGGLKDGSVEQG